MTLTEARAAIRDVLDTYQSIYWEREENATTLRDLSPAEERFLADINTIGVHHDTWVGQAQDRYGDCSQQHIEAIEKSTIEKARKMLAAREELRDAREMEEAA